MPEPLFAKAIEALRCEDFATARDCIEIYEREQPLEIRHYLVRGLAEIALKNWSGARDTLSRAIENYPDNAQLLFNLGMAQENLGELNKAAVSYGRSLELNADQAEAYGNLSNVFYRLSRFTEAENMAIRALHAGAPRAQALNSLGLSLDRQNKSQQAATAFEDALQLEPDNIFVLSNFANLAADQFEFDNAWRRFAAARAKSDAPFIRHHEGMARLLSGDYAAGWPLYEARLEVAGGLRVKPPIPRYNGEALARKTLMLVAEQGYGDVIQFCRYGALLGDVELVWVVPKNLKRLLDSNLRGHVIGEDETLPAADFYLPILSMPLSLGLPDLKDAPKAPYINAAISPALLGEAGKCRIGLVWSGSRTHERDHERSIAPTHFRTLMEKIPAQFYAPFVGAGLEQAAGLPITRLDHLIGDFADTAGLLQQLDCLITVDTAVAHLAGALRVRTYLLLPYLPDWRWGVKGETTPWYQNFTLLRQQRPGDWSAPLARLAELLTADA